jgi:hypothetical protein
MYPLLLLALLLTDQGLCANNTLSSPEDITFGERGNAADVCSNILYISGPVESSSLIPCFADGFGLATTSPAIGAGIEIEGFTCPAPGHPGDGNCLEWFNLPGPDIGACQAVYLSEAIALRLEP